jgi:hypothetical protein
MNMPAAAAVSDAPAAVPARAPLPDPFPVARYRLRFEVERPLRLPEYAGSALRGVFGHALKRLACVTRERDCKACALYRSCRYPAVFETPPPADARRVYSEIPHPFVVEPPPWGARDFAAGAPLDLHLVLIGPALAQLPLVLMAWQRALEIGLGPAEGTARLRCVHAEGDADPVLDDPRGRLREHAAQVALPAADAAPAEVTLDFVTPLRLKRDGHALGIGSLAPADLLMALVRRSAELCELQLGRPTGWDFAALKRAAAAVSGAKQLAWRDWTRWSNRQQQHMKFSGAVGQWHLTGDLRPFWPLLHLGQWLHVGGKATFGLGHYRLLPGAVAARAATAAECPP